MASKIKVEDTEDTKFSLTIIIKININSCLMEPTVSCIIFLVICCIYIQESPG